MSHVIHRLSFGEDFPNILNPLDNAAKLSRACGPPGGSRTKHGAETDARECVPSVAHVAASRMQMFQYFIKVVPTDFIYLNGTVLKTNQFSFTENSLESAVRQSSLPGTGIVTDGRATSRRGRRSG